MFSLPIDPLADCILCLFLTSKRREWDREKKQLFYIFVIIIICLPWLAVYGQVGGAAKAPAKKAEQPGKDADMLAKMAKVTMVTRGEWEHLVGLTNCLQINENCLIFFL